MKTILLTAVMFAVAATTTAATAGFVLPPPVAPPPAIGGSNSEHETALFAGFNWRFGKTATLEGVLGVIYRETERDGDVNGARASLHFDLLRRGVSPNLRLTGIVGDENIAAEAGLGIGFDGTPFGVLGGIGDYYNFGATIGFDGSLGGYVGAHTYGDFDDRPRAAPVIPLGPG